MLYRKFYKLITLTSLWIILMCGSAAAQSIQVSIIVAANSNEIATLRDAKKIFAAQLLHWSNGSSVHVVYQDDTELGKLFFERFVNQNINKIKSTWNKLILSGQASPPIKGSNDFLVKLKVAEDPLAIGFIESKNLDNSVKEILRITVFKSDF